MRLLGLIPNKIKTTISEDNFIVVISLYMFGVSLPRALGVDSEHSSILLLWELASLVLLLGLGLTIYRSSIKMKTWQISLFAAYIVTQILISTTYTVTHDNLTFSIVNQLMGAAYLFIFFGVYGGLKFSPQSFYRLNKVVISFVIFACLYNLVVNFESIIEFLTISSPYEQDIKSFFSNRNTFSYVLASGVMLAIVNIDLARKWAETRSRNFAYYAIIAFLLCNMLLTLSRGGLLLIATFSLIYFILSRGVIRGAIKVAITTAMLVATVLLVAGSTFVEKNLIRTDYGSTGRDDIHSYGVNYFLSHNIFTGSGYVDPSLAVYNYSGYESFHNGYITALVSGGLLLFIFYAVLFFYTLRNMLYVYHKEKYIGAMFLAFLIAFSAYNFIESFMLLQKGSTEGTIFRLYLLFIPLYVAQYFKAKEYNTQYITAKRSA